MPGKENIVRIIGRHTKLEAKGLRYFGLCPFHKEQTPSFSVSQGQQTFYCFGCRAHGNADDFERMIGEMKG